MNAGVNLLEVLLTFLYQSVAEVVTINRTSPKDYFSFDERVQTP